MIEWVVERASRAKNIDDVIVATDDVRIMEAVASFGGKAVMTSKSHVSGTDRIAEAVLDLDCSIVVNVQGDEPLTSPENIDLVINPFLEDLDLEVSTLKIRLRESRDIFNPNVTKVVTNCDGYAIYFSRSPIPFNRDHWGNVFDSESERNVDAKFIEAYKHIGLYGFSKSFLLKFSNWLPSRLEELEKLEQLRILGRGVPILVMETQLDSIGVDCPEDLLKIEQFLNNHQI
tara:strand:+ start:690 stop:1382 length:693 start_codon:yes stop_codon:yes gene_type:complete